MRGRPSLTARHVATQRARLDRPAGPAGDADADQRLQESIGGWVRFVGSNGVPMEARTRFFDDATRDAIADGIRQIVILGAGYDGRALRFADPNVQFFEVDHPSTQTDKRRRLHDLGANVDRIRFVGADLVHDDLAAALDTEGFDASQPTFFTCEGLLPYLSCGDGERLLTSAATAAPASRLAVNFFIRPAAPAWKTKVTRRAVDGLMALIGEPRRCQFTSGDPERLLTACGWRIDHTHEADHERDDHMILALASVPG